MTSAAHQTAPASNTGSVATIIPPEAHPITLEMIDRDALYVMRTLNRAGFAAYLVGGGVRDLYLGKRPKDFDISTDARPGQIRKLFPNSSTIGRRFRLVQAFFARGKVIEISTLRSLSEHDLDGPEAVLAPNNTFGTLDEDAQRRDLTINSLFYEIENNTIIDHLGGVADLDAAIVRIIGKPEKRITRDPVRMMRAIRHSARNNFSIERETWQTICDNHSKLLLCPPSRLRDETLKDIYGGFSSSWFELAVESGIFLDLFAIYRKYFSLHKNRKQNCQKQLESIFRVIDRINTTAVANGAARQPDSFMLALVLLPWAETRYQIISRKFSGPTLFQISKKIRAELDEKIGQQLNLRRSVRQNITNLLASLPQLIQHHKDGRWPAWLRKKSYFTKGVLFYHCYLEASNGKPVPKELLCEYAEPSPGESPKSPRQRSHSQKSRKRPAFAATAAHSIFGMTKKKSTAASNPNSPKKTTSQ